MAEKFTLKIEALQSLHRFGDIYEDAIRSVESNAVSFEPVRTARDSIGRHWYGMRCKMECKATGQGFYLHTGLIFLPSTRTGLMVEVDRKNNLPSYAQVWDRLKSCEAFEVEHGEEEYLKLFMPDAQFKALGDMTRAEQIKALASYVKACGEAIAEAAYTQGFRLGFADLADAYRISAAVETALDTAESDLYIVEPNKRDPDNFGQYAAGYRYHLYSPDKTVDMYAYFGSIYSYKKSPAGIFAEIDWFSNQGVFDKVKANFRDSDAFVYSSAEPKFIKLFLPQVSVDALNAADAEGQAKILAEFLNVCNTHLMQAALA